MLIGIRDGLLGRPLLECFGVAAELGFDGIEACIGQDYAESLLWSEGGAQTILGAAASADVAVAALSPGVYARLHPLVDDAGKRAEGETMLGQVIDLCPQLDCESILVPIFPRDFGGWTDAQWGTFAGGLRRLADQAEVHDVTLGLETTLDADTLLHLLDRIDSPAAGVYYDVANTTSFGFDAPAELRKLGGAVVMIHIKDTDGQHLGEGGVPFYDVAAAIADIGYDGWLILETPKGDAPLDSARRNLDFTRTLI